MNITNELLAAYAEGNVSQEERLAVRQYLTENPQEWDSMLMMMDEDYDITLDEDDVASLNTSKLDDNLGELLTELDSQELTDSDFRILPAMAMAAENKVDNLCVIHCEGLALRRFGFDISDEELMAESRKEGWLQQTGTALHNIGRLAGSHGLGVSHRYECAIEDIQESLSAGHIVLAAVDANELIGNYAEEKQKDITDGKTPNHVVIVESINEDTVTITDSATPQQHDVYPLSQFFDAWDDSSRYLIIISDGEEYEPHPIDLSDVEISDDLIELREAIAENAHEVWAYNRKQEGWTYGPERDDAKKLHPDMIAYNRLPESEKLYDREMAMNTIKLLKKLGWELKKTETHTKNVFVEQPDNSVWFSEIERCAIASLALKLIVTDASISPKELAASNVVFRELDITSSHENNLPTYSQACQIYKNMDATKQETVKDMLHQIAMADGVIAEKEQAFIENLEK